MLFCSLSHVQKLRCWSTALGCYAWQQVRWQQGGINTLTGLGLAQIPFGISAAGFLLKTEPCMKILTLEPLSLENITQYLLLAGPEDMWGESMLKGTTVPWTLNINLWGMNRWSKAEAELMTQIQPVGESQQLMGKSLCAVGARKVVFTQEAVFNNETGRTDKLGNY